METEAFRKQLCWDFGGGGIEAKREAKRLHQTGEEEGLEPPRMASGCQVLKKFWVG